MIAPGQDTRASFRLAWNAVDLAAEGVQRIDVHSARQALVDVRQTASHQHNHPVLNLSAARGGPAQPSTSSKPLLLCQKTGTNTTMFPEIAFTKWVTGWHFC
jgi:hypothetical protein